MGFSQHPVKRRPALRYHGGKWLLAAWIISHFPPHRVYVESYGGAASVLLQKPRTYAEIYNELNPEIVSYFRVLRQPRKAAELKRLLELTPFAREEFREAYKSTDNDIESARRLVIRSFMGFGSAAHNSRHATGFRCSSERSGTTPAIDWRNFPEALPFLTERLRGVTVESVPAVELIRQRDGVDYLHYVDPPYVHVTRQHRQRGNYGKYEMDDRDHEELSETLHQARGMVVLSGYDSQLYRRLYGNWQRVEKRTFGNSNRGAAPRTEVLWLNAQCALALSSQIET